MKNKMVVSANELKKGDYMCNLVGTVKEIKRIENYLEIKYDVRGRLNFIQSSNNYQFAIMRKLV